ncbi:MAG: hypothetical protein ACLUPV_05085 [Bilophila wadsworthia]
MAERFGVSRTPVTIALNRLVAEDCRKTAQERLFYSQSQL